MIRYCCAISIDFGTILKLLMSSMHANVEMRGYLSMNVIHCDCASCDLIHCQNVNAIETLNFYPSPICCCCDCAICYGIHKKLEILNKIKSK